jgi:hypothetical protein
MDPKLSGESYRGMREVILGCGRLSWDAGGYPGMREIILGCGRLSWDAGGYPGMREVILGCGRLSWDTGESYRGMLEYIRGGMSEGPSERGRSVIPE